MKTLIMSGLILLTSISFAGEVCQKKAVQTARENGFWVNQVYDVESIDAGKSYLVAYRVRLVDSIKAPKKSELIDVILMVSDCSVVSVKPILN